MNGQNSETEFFGGERISKILFRLAPPIMLAQLIQALYNIVDSFFVGKYAESGLTALSIVYPLQLLMIALAVGTGVGINTVMASNFGLGRVKRANEFAGLAAPLAAGLWLLFAAMCQFIMPFYARISTDSPDVIADVVTYGRITCVFSFGLFFESVWTKVVQAEGNMKTPMLAQIFGAAVNIVLDPILIFGAGGFEGFGIAGAAAATVIGQTAAALIVMKKGFRKPPALYKFRGHIYMIFRFGLPNMLMQSAYTFYIFGLNMILAGFSDQAVTTLGLYYKWQTFFFIPLSAMQTCIVPMVSFNYSAGNVKRCRKTVGEAVLFGAVLMALGTLCFETVPTQMLRLFTKDDLVIEIGTHAFHIIGISFIPMVASLIFPVFFQAVGQGLKSSLLTIVRTVFLFVPLGYVFSCFGLDAFWFTFPATDTISALLGYVLFRRFMRSASLSENQLPM